MKLARLSSNSQMIIAALFSLLIGLGVGFFALAPRHEAGIGNLASSDPIKVFGKNECNLVRPERKDYQFEAGDYFTTENRLDWWTANLTPLASRPLKYLEVGVYEGRSMLWMLDNVLKHPESTAAGIDIVLYRNYMENLARSGACDRVTTYVGRSQELLHILPGQSFDLIYIDASHLGKDVLSDAVLSFELLKVGGLMIFDDYRWYPDWVSDIRPGVAIDSFITMYRNELELVHRDYQLVLRKRVHPCAKNPYRYSPVGAYCYHWVTGDLVRQADGMPVDLLPGDREMIEAIARSAPFGEIRPVVDATMRARPAFQQMNRRLGLIAD